MAAFAVFFTTPHKKKNELGGAFLVWSSRMQNVSLFQVTAKEKNIYMPIKLSSICTIIVRIKNDVPIARNCPSGNLV